MFNILLGMGIGCLQFQAVHGKDDRSGFELVSGASKSTRGRHHTGSKATAPFIGGMYSGSSGKYCQTRMLMFQVRNVTIIKRPKILPTH